MALPDVSMRDLLEAGAHFGHRTHRWNPKMAPYIYGARNGIHIIDLSQTLPMLHQALVKVSEVAATGGRVLFVGTKRQASEPIRESAEACAQYYINHRWLGGTLTNWKTISNSIRTLRELEDILDSEKAAGFTKKELLQLTRKREKLQRALGGIKDMGGTPDIMFVIDTNKEQIAIKEANRLGIPVVAVVDTNCDPDGIDFPIPANDDAVRAIALYCDLVSKAVLDGISRSAAEAGVDIGEMEAPPVEEAVTETTGEPAAEEAPAEEAAAEPVEEAPAEEPAAEQPAETKEEKPVEETAPAEADDLKQISGVGPVLEKKLHEAGYTTFRQIAEMTPEQIAELDAKLNFKGRIERDDWVGQAKKLMDGKSA
ncbi:MAG TPA: 30S ribosomal protein S2 [Thermopetrobacter sp.]|nr:30S ribosomal protein S2 [Thermopetrobacter sp.]